MKWNDPEFPTEEINKILSWMNQVYTRAKFFLSFRREWVKVPSVWLLWINIFLENNKDPMTSSKATYISQFSTLLASSFWKRGGEKRRNDFYTIF